MRQKVDDLSIRSITSHSFCQATLGFATSPKEPLDLAGSPLRWTAAQPTYILAISALEAVGAVKQNNISTKRLA